MKQIAVPDCYFFRILFFSKNDFPEILHYIFGHPLSYIADTLAHKPEW